MKNTTLTLLLSLAACLPACGDDDDGDPAPIDAAAGPDAAGPDAGVAWTPLIGATWTMPAGVEGYYCASKTLTETIYVGGFRPIAPLGTHHTVVSFGAPSAPDTTGASCGPLVENPKWIYASGVGTGELMFPEGVGVVLEAGQQVHINLHLFNSGDAEIGGDSGVEFISIAQADVVHEGELFLPGAIGFNGVTSVVGTCTASAPQTLFALFPHMHQTGLHLKSVVTVAGAPTTLWDEAYQFDSQEFVRFPEVTLAAGDTITTTCDYSAPASFGFSSTQEMCFSIMLRYPRLIQNGMPFCSN